jgi:hypothetical protein
MCVAGNVVVLSSIKIGAPAVRLEVGAREWVPPVGGAPSRHTGTGGAADGVHAQCLRDSGAGDTGVELCTEASS